MSESGKSLAYLFATQLVARGVRPDGSSNKVLWVSKGVGAPRITAHPADSNSPTVEIGGQVTNGNQMPSMVDLPSSGCWSFDLSWGHTKDRIELNVLPEGSAPSRSN